MVLLSNKKRAMFRSNTLEHSIQVMSIRKKKKIVSINHLCYDFETYDTNNSNLYVRKAEIQQ